MLTPEETRELLEVARRAIGCALRNQPFVPNTMHQNLLRPGAAFVTLRIDHNLHGCIGYIESLKPLVETVAEVAVKAACEDSRFSPVTLEDLDRLQIEISVLSPLQRINSPGEIQPGVHGVVAALGPRRGVLLPQVATEHGLNATEFVDAVLRKAGIPTSMLGSPDLELYVFEAEVIRESDYLADAVQGTKTGN